MDSISLNKQSRMLDDYLNEWTAKRMIFALKGNTDADILKEPRQLILEMPIQTYTEYVQTTWKKDANRILDQSDRRKIKIADMIAAQYNKEIKNGHLDKTTFQIYYNSIAVLVQHP